MSQQKRTIRRKFRDVVFNRDKYKCVFCGETKNLDAYHITNRVFFNNGGYIKENGITLCEAHHLEIEIVGPDIRDYLYKKN